MKISWIDKWEALYQFDIRQQNSRHKCLPVFTEKNFIPKNQLAIASYNYYNYFSCYSVKLILHLALMLPVVATTGIVGSGALKMLDVKMTVQMTWHETAGHENAGYKIAQRKRARYETGSDAANVWGWIDWVEWAFLCSLSQLRYEKNVED